MCSTRIRQLPRPASQPEGCPLRASRSPKSRRIRSQAADQPERQARRGLNDARRRHTDASACLAMVRSPMVGISTCRRSLYMRSALRHWCCADWSSEEQGQPARREMRPEAERQCGRRRGRKSRTVEKSCLCMEAEVCSSGVTCISPHAHDLVLRSVRARQLSLCRAWGLCARKKSPAGVFAFFDEFPIGKGLSSST